MLENIFTPLFEVTIDPSSNPRLHSVLPRIVGFDSVDDESAPEMRVDLAKVMPPQAIDGRSNPSYAYYSYYLWSNLLLLNSLREARGLCTFAYRPHGGEAGDVDHLAVNFLLAESVNHGLNLRKSPALQYLYYLAQVGLCMSPLSNNKLFIELQKNPLPEYFRKGLNVSLSTDDPLQFHVTKEPLMEEYSVAAQVWKLSSTDLCELARNSVIQSGFEASLKERWISPKWRLMGEYGNDIHKTNVPYSRLRYRRDTLLNELAFVYGSVDSIPKNMKTLPNFNVE
mmetsp:Transcript_16488/g.44269  ORF Transcript_16488/g.44269 Transcript_16488/m.44269 type:complete len:283 (-) Transcript_16488:763-1611(-)